MLLALGELEEQRSELELQLAATQAQAKRRDTEAQQELAAVRAALGDAHDKISFFERQSGALQVGLLPEGLGG